MDQLYDCMLSLSMLLSAILTPLSIGIVQEVHFESSLYVVLTLCDIVSFVHCYRSIAPMTWSWLRCYNLVNSTRRSVYRQSANTVEEYTTYQHSSHSTNTTVAQLDPSSADASRFGVTNPDDTASSSLLMTHGPQRSFLSQHILYLGCCSASLWLIPFAYLAGFAGRNLVLCSSPRLLSFFLLDHWFLDAWYRVSSMVNTYWTICVQARKVYDRTFDTKVRVSTARITATSGSSIPPVRQSVSLLVNDMTARLLTLSLKAVFYMSYFACLWFFISTNITDHVPLSALHSSEQMLLHCESQQVTSWVCDDAYVLVVSSPSSRYIRSLHFVVQTFFTIGFGDISPASWTELLFTLFLILNASLFLGLLISSITSVLNNRNISANSFRQEVELVQSYCKKRGVAPDLQDKVEGYFKWLFTRQKGLAEQRILMALPPMLRFHYLNAMLYQSFRGSVPYFKHQKSTHFVRLCVSKCQLRSYPTGIEVVSVNQIQSEIIFIRSGRFEVFKPKPKTVLSSDDNKSCEESEGPRKSGFSIRGSLKSLIERRGSSAKGSATRKLNGSDMLSQPSSSPALSDHTNVSNLLPGDVIGDVAMVCSCDCSGLGPCSGSSLEPLSRNCTMRNKMSLVSVVSSACSEVAVLNQTGLAQAIRTWECMHSQDADPDSVHPNIVQGADEGDVSAEVTIRSFMQRSHQKEAVAATQKASADQYEKFLRVEQSAIKATVQKKRRVLDMMMQQSLTIIQSKIAPGIILPSSPFR